MPPRRIKVTDEFIEAFTGLIATGLTIKQAAQRLGMSPKTVYKWMLFGRNGHDQEGRTNTKLVRQCKKLWAEYKRREHELYINALQTVSEHAARSPSVAQWVLERLDPDRWSRPMVIDLRAGKEDLQKMDDDDLDKLARMLGVTLPEDLEEGRK